MLAGVGKLRCAFSGFLILQPLEVREEQRLADFQFDKQLFCEADRRPDRAQSLNRDKQRGNAPFPFRDVAMCRIDHSFFHAAGISQPHRETDVSNRGRQVERGKKMAVIAIIG